MIIFTGDLYSMYVVLQGIGSPSCIIIIYVIPFGEQQSWMSEVRKLERFNKKTGPPKWSISFHIVLKNEFFKLTEGYPPRPVSENYEKTILQWKPMELGGIPSKMMNIFTGDLYSMYVVLQGIGSPSCIIIIYVIPFGE